MMTEEEYNKSFWDIEYIWECIHDVERRLVKADKSKYADLMRVNKIPAMIESIKELLKRIDDLQIKRAEYESSHPQT